MKIQILMLLTVLFCFSLSAQQKSLIDFKMEDQFGKSYKKADYVGLPIIMLAGDRAGSKFIEEWYVKLRDSLKVAKPELKVSFLPVANLDGVPFFLKGFVKGKLPQEKEKWSLLDWSGDFEDEYEFKEDLCNILIFDKNHKLILQKSVGKLNKEDLKKMFETLVQ